MPSRRPSEAPRRPRALQQPFRSSPEAPQGPPTATVILQRLLMSSSEALQLYISTSETIQKPSMGLFRSISEAPQRLSPGAHHELFCSRSTAEALYKPFRFQGPSRGLPEAPQKPSTGLPGALQKLCRGSSDA
eukprot:8849069-Pyramimonas_sp.AAC.1